MEGSKKIITVIGGGLIGSSWATLFALRGDTVRIVEPVPAVAQTVKSKVLEMIKETLDISNTYGVDRNIEVYTGLALAVVNAYAIQEAAPEEVKVKQSIFAEVEKHAAKDALLLSSSSGITHSIAGSRMSNPSRLIIGHPFNPPHLMPLVEISAGPQTEEKLIKKVIAFYKAYGKVPVQIYDQVPDRTVPKQKSFL